MSTQFTNRQWRLPNNENKDKQSNYSMNFKPSNSAYLTFSDISLTGEFTISFWMNPDAFYGVVVGDSSNANWLRIQSTTQTTLKNNNQAGTTWESGATFTTGEWQHVVLRRDSSNVCTIFRNGIHYTNNSPTRTGTFGPLNKIGQKANINYFDGKLDAVSIFDYALSSSQVTTLYGSSSTGIGNPMSLSPKPVAYYPLGDQDAFNGADYLVPNSSLKDYVFNFNSSSSNYIDFNSIDLGTTNTISFWHKRGNTAQNQYVLGSTDGTQKYILYFTSNYIYIRPDGSTQFITAYLGNTPYPFPPYKNTTDWANYIITRSGDNIKLYLNGVEFALSGSGSGMAATTVNRIGTKGNVVSNTIDGELSNIQFFNTALTDGTGGTPNQIETLYNNGSPLTSMTGFTSLVSWWKLDASDTYDGTNWTIEDHAGSNDGTSSGMTQANLVQSNLSFTSGYSPYALDFDSSSSDHIQIPYNVNLTPQNGNFTISAWINTDNLSGWHSIWCTQNLFSSNIPLVSLHTFGDKVRAVVGGSTNNPSYPGSWALLLDSTESLTTSTWYHIAVSYDMSGDAQIYINGNADNSGPIENPQTSWTTSDRFIGDGEDFWDGRISNLSIWNTDLTSAQVTELYNEGVPSNLNNHSVYSNLISWWQLGNNTSWVDPYWIALDEKGTNNGQSQNVAAPNNMGENAIVDGVGSYANGLSSGMGGDEVVGDAPYSTSNALSVNMDVEDRVTDTPS